MTDIELPSPPKLDDTFVVHTPKMYELNSCGDDESIEDYEEDPEPQDGDLLTHPPPPQQQPGTMTVRLSFKKKISDEETPTTKTTTVTATATSTQSPPPIERLKWPRNKRLLSTDILKSVIQLLEDSETGRNILKELNVPSIDEAKKVDRRLKVDCRRRKDKRESLKKKIVRSQAALERHTKAIEAYKIDVERVIIVARTAEQKFKTTATPNDQTPNQQQQHKRKRHHHHHHHHKNQKYTKTS